MYLGAVKCAINYAFANRQVITYLIRKTFKKIFRNAKLEILYDVGHNTVKEEIHIINGKKQKVYVHRKGSTRGFGPNTIGIPHKYFETGQPIIVGGSMGTASYILCGSELAMSKTLGSTVHGAGRSPSRNQAKKSFSYDKVVKQLESKGIILISASKGGVVEEAPQAYKDIDEIIESISQSGISKKVAKLRPIIKHKRLGIIFFLYNHLCYNLFTYFTSNIVYTFFTFIFSRFYKSFTSLNSFGSYIRYIFYYI